MLKTLFLEVNSFKDWDAFKQKKYFELSKINILLNEGDIFTYRH